jgi:hypothetical protein
VVLHPHAVAEDRPAGERRRRVDREDGDARDPRIARDPQQRAGQSRLSRARGAGDAERVRLTAEWVREPADLARRRAALLDQRQQARERPPVAAARGIDERFDIRRLGQTPEATNPWARDRRTSRSRSA